MLRSVVLLLLALVLAGCNLSSITPTATPAPDIPQVEFQFPANNSVVVEGTDVQIQLLAQDPRGVGVARVELRVDDMFLQEGSPVASAAVTVFTIDMNWLAEGVGGHALSAVAYRPDGTMSEFATIRLQVIAPVEATPTP
jgi:Bacterial Ig domain